MAKQEIQEQYEEYIASLMKYLKKIEDKVALFIHLNQKLHTKSKAIEHAPVIFLPILESLLVDSIISIAKLYEGRAERNLIKFLNFVEGNIHNLEWGHQPITREQIDQQRALMDSHNGLVNNILGQRDKFFAHHDKEYFHDSSMLSSDFPLSNSDIETLINTAHKIIGEHSFALNKAVPMATHEFVVVAIEQMFSALNSYYSKEEEKYEVS